MTFSVALLDERNLGGLDARAATRLAALAFAERGFDPEDLGEVSVVLVEAEEMRSLNERFRGKSHPTDVLSFEVDGPEGEMVGEIVLCPMCADMSLEELVVHGALHLAGMDHDEQDFESSEMSEVQARLMEKAREERK